MLYLERYPQASGRIILDAPLRPNGKIDALLLDSIVAQQSSFELLLDACGRTLPDCDRTTVEAAFVARINTLLDAGDRETFGALLKTLNIAIDEFDSGEFLAPLLIEYALNGDPTEMFALLQEFGLDEEDDEIESLTFERLCSAPMTAQDRTPSHLSLHSAL